MIVRRTLHGASTVARSCRSARDAISCRSARDAISQVAAPRANARRNIATPHALHYESSRKVERGSGAPVNAQCWQQARRYASSVTHVSASKDAPREVPTPVVFVSASKWTGEASASETFKAFEQHLTRHGWNVSHIDLDIGDAAKSAKNSEEILTAFENELAKQMRSAAASSAGAPFPPIMVSAGLSTIFAEQYVSSHPLSGLVLIDPPLTLSHAQEANAELLPTKVGDFTYEIRFPALVAWTPEGDKKLLYWDVHRIESAREDEADEALARYIWDINSDADEHGSGPHEMRKWAEDDCGINTSKHSPPQDEAVNEHSNTTSDKEVQSVPRSGQGDKSPTNELPDWFLQGKYERSKSGSKKEPLVLDEGDIEESFIRGSGPGGQAINKLATCVQLKHVPTGLTLKCQETRDRRQNRIIARRRLSRDLEHLVFGRDSVMGREQYRAQKRKSSKGRKQARKTRERDAAGSDEAHE